MSIARADGNICSQSLGTTPKVLLGGCMGVISRDRGRISLALPGITQNTDNYFAISSLQFTIRQTYNMAI